MIQVGFQSLGSHALEKLRADAFGIGPVVRLGAVGAWSRTVGYWSRSAWSGRRSLHGRAVVDGVVTNPLAHAVATALAVVGCRSMDDVDVVETDLYRANAIDSDDTSAVRIRTAWGLEVTCALTLCAPVQREPEVRIEGAHGRVTFAYTADRSRSSTPAAKRRPRSWSGRICSRTCWHTGGMDRRCWYPREHRSVHAGVRRRFRRRRAHQNRPASHPLGGEGQIGARSSRTSRTGSRKRFRRARRSPNWECLGPPRTRQRPGPGPNRRCRGRALRRRAGHYSTSSPRPVLHPVRTLAGAVLTALHPADHDWHLGVGMAMPM